MNTEFKWMIGNETMFKSSRYNLFNIICSEVYDIDDEL